jgi:tetratricopeptide (TPR) repeat protein
MRTSVEVMRIVIRILGCVALAAWPAVVDAQPSAPPTRVASASTPAEDAAIEEGARLHDQGKYNEAIAKYEEILKLSPNNMTALYELAYSFAENKEFEKSLAAATRGTEYSSPLLPLFYDLIGSAFDSLGDPQKAIETYRKGIQIVPDAAMLHYNMGVTYLESLKNPDEARRAFEKAAAIDPKEPAFQLMLGQVLQTSGYKTPALFAFSTYLILEPTGPRSLSAYGFWRAILRGGLETRQPGSPDTMMRNPATATAATPASKTDEGDFADFEKAITLSQQTVIADMDNGAEELPALLAHVNRLFALLATRSPERDRGTFAAARYLPFFLELKEKNYVEPFVYWVIQRAPVGGVREWITANQTRVREFVTWSRGYAWPKL